MRYNFRTLVLFFSLFILILSGCGTGEPDFEKMRSEILALHKAMIDAHLKKDVDYIVDCFSDDFIFVANGNITTRTKEQHREIFNSYLSNTDFSEYKDVSDPVIRFSKDGSTAWSIVKVRVVDKRKSDDGSVKDRSIVYAWITIYERKDNKWVRTVEVSTNK